MVPLTDIIISFIMNHCCSNTLRIVCYLLFLYVQANFIEKVLLKLIVKPIFYIKIIK